MVNDDTSIPRPFRASEIWGWKEDIRHAESVPQRSTPLGLQVYVFLDLLPWDSTPECSYILAIFLFYYSMSTFPTSPVTHVEPAASVGGQASPQIASLRKDTDSMPPLPE